MKQNFRINFLIIKIRKSSEVCLLLYFTVQYCLVRMQKKTLIHSYSRNCYTVLTILLSFSFKQERTASTNQIANNFNRSQRPLKGKSNGKKEKDNHNQKSIIEFTVYNSILSTKHNYQHVSPLFTAVLICLKKIYARMVPNKYKYVFKRTRNGLRN